MGDFLFIGSVFCALISAYLLFFNKIGLQSFSDKILATLFLSYSYCVIVFLLISSGWIVHAPFLYKTSAPINYLVPPLAYLYVRSVLYNESKFEKKDFIHLVPFLIITFNYLPIYFSSYNERLEVVKLVIIRYDNNYLIQDGFFSENIQILRPIQSLVYLVLQWKILIDFKKKNITISFKEHTLMIFKWLKKFNYCISFTNLTFLIFVFGVAYSLANKQPLNEVVLYAAIPISISLLYLSSYLIINPHVLAGLPYIGKELKNNPKSFIKEVNYELEIATIKSYFEVHKPFLQPSLTIGQLSLSLDLSPKVVSFIINQCLNQNFNDFVNSYRVASLIESMQQGGLKNYTIQALALQAGFANKTSCMNAFKKVHNCTPSQYIANKKDNL
ncbi:MAG: helix-turn-helix domain-containing protein [Chitinophagaceae bacterium]|nr:helix-turn-helix domain-containing protein [Chitinophagaceae bacterium]